MWPSSLEHPGGLLGTEKHHTLYPKDKSPLCCTRLTDSNRALNALWWEAEEQQTAASGFDMMMYQTMKTPGLIQTTLWCPDGCRVGESKCDLQAERERGNKASALEVWEYITESGDGEKDKGALPWLLAGLWVLRAFILFCQANILLLKITFTNTLPRASA